MPIGKSIFVVNFPLNLSRATVANADTESRKSLHTLIDMYLDHMLGKIEANRMVQNVQKFELFDEKKTSYNCHVVDAILQEPLSLKQFFNRI